MKKATILLGIACGMISCARPGIGRYVDPATPADARPYLQDEACGADWELVFSDEFDDERVDSLKWKVIDQNKGFKDGIHRYFRRHNIAENGGCLEVIYRHEGDSTYTSGKVSTHGLYAGQYGFFECRMHVVRTDGHQMAFWMMPEDSRGMNGIVDGTANDGAEIDIVETMRRSDHYSCGLHWDGYSKGHRANGKVVKAPGLHASGMNVYALEWTPERLTFYFNGKAVRTMTDSILIPRVKEHLILSGCCFAGGWTDGDIRENRQLPDTSFVDYVRVYKLKKSGK